METGHYEIYEEMTQEARIRRSNETKICARITRLETALTATIHALALGETTLPDEYRHIHGLAGQETARHLLRAAQTLGLDLTSLGLEGYDES